ncbi:hypothetical protein F2Q70_00021362 [Brassica cretica]|uniref:SF4 helicase domain-containing protein n=1 Tax=Brassica cretica TaxID=69181 RepID=A0A8S9GWH9_BRACR|nr:hypothetical protein F2Q70_00021362 [Brassica cretica]
MRFLLRLPKTHLRKLSSSMSVLMGSKQFLEFCLLPSFAASSPSCTRGAQRQLSSVSRRFRPVLASRPVSKSSPYHQRPNGVSPYTSISRAPNPGNVLNAIEFSVSMFDPEDGAVQSRLANLRLKLADNGIDAQNCPSGQYSGLICPECEGGDSGEKSLSLFIAADCSSATWNCFRGKCGLKGGVRVDGRFATSVVPMEKAERKVTVESLELEPLCDEVVPGELTVVTGVPNSGKSEWIDALLCNLNHSVGWKFALCSMENKVRDHGRKLLEKHVKKPFFDADYGRSVPRMSVEELDEGKLWLDDTFTLIRCELDSLPSIGWVLERAKAAVLRHGIRGLVIDPYNELDHQRTQRQTETEYVSQMLTKIKRFAQHHSCHVWFVAHPKQLQQWDGGPPNLYDISGSAHFINKCDNGIVIHRNRDEKAGPLDLVQVSTILFFLICNLL